MKSYEAGRNALKCVLEETTGERIIIFCDKEKERIGKTFAKTALDIRL